MIVSRLEWWILMVLGMNMKLLSALGSALGALLGSYNIHRRPKRWRGQHRSPRRRIVKVGVDKLMRGRNFGVNVALVKLRSVCYFNCTTVLT